MTQPTIKEFRIHNIETKDGRSMTKVYGLGEDNCIYTWEWVSGSWKMDAKDDRGGAF